MIFRLGPGETPDVLLDGQGGRGRVDEDALVGPKGQRLARLPGVLSYWFAWASYHPETALRKAPFTPAPAP